MASVHPPTVTCLMPGPTDTNFFERAGLLDTEIGQGKKELKWRA